MKPPIRVGYEAIYPWRHRIRDLIARIFGAEPRRAQRLHMVTIGGQRFKRVALYDVYRALRIERMLEDFGPSPHLPKFVMRSMNTIWMEFVEGEDINDVGEHLVRLTADFYGEIYGRGPQQIETERSGFPGQLQQDLEFLNRIGLLNDATFSHLWRTARRVMPSHVWIGFDYSDPALKNFLLVNAGNRLCAVDMESLGDNKLIGSGVAKACFLWLDPYRDLFFECVSTKGTPDFISYFLFVELVFLAQWTKRNILLGKWKRIDPTALERFRTLTTS